MKKLMLFMSAFALLVSTSWADTVTYTTQGNIVSGQAASASDVTTAFTEVKTAVDANDGNITSLQGGVPGSTCTGNDGSDIMVRVGPLCVDKYETSIWDAKTGGTQDTTPGTTCSGNGNDCTTGYFAQSRLGVTPATGVTWFQAQQACGRAGKRLLTNAEWQMAAAGTPDNSTCTTGSLANTGANTGCVSNWSVNDMVGNVHEWVADWMQGDTTPYTPSSGTAGGSYGDDIMAGPNPATVQGSGSTNMPSAVYRGGRAAAGTNGGVFAFVATTAPSEANADIGFRCAR